MMFQCIRTQCVMIESSQLALSLHIIFMVTYLKFTCFCFCFWDSVSLHSPGCLRTPYVDQVGLNLPRSACLSLQSKCWDWRCEPLHRLEILKLYWNIHDVEYSHPACVVALQIQTSSLYCVCMCMYTLWPESLYSLPPHLVASILALCFYRIGSLGSHTFSKMILHQSGRVPFLLAFPHACSLLPSPPFCFQTGLRLAQSGLKLTVLLSWWWPTSISPLLARQTWATAPCLCGAGHWTLDLMLANQTIYPATYHQPCYLLCFKIKILSGVKW